MKLRLISVAAPLVFATAATVAASAAFAEPTSWSLDINAAFTYYDQIKSLQLGNPTSTKSEVSPGLAGTNKADALTAVSQGEARTPGLRYLAIATKWIPRPNVSLNLLFRPDASIRDKDKDKDNGVVRELDTRAGETLQPMPEVKLLDAYQLVYGSPDRSQFAIGTFTSMVQPRAAFTPILDFGQSLLLPQKFLGVTASWNYGLSTNVNPEKPIGSYLRPQVFLMEGSGDRGESIRREQGDYDESLMAKDPQRGGGASLEWGNDRLDQVIFMAAYEEAGLQIGKTKNTYAGLFFYKTLSGPRLGLQFSGDYRFLQNAVQGTEVAQATLNQHAASLSAALGITKEHQVGTRLSFGSGQRASLTSQTEVISIKGYGADLLYYFNPMPDTTLALQIGEEVRENEFHGQNADGFASGSEHAKRIHRFALELRQYINGSSLK